MRVTAWYEPMLERGLFPDALVRMGIRRQLAARLRSEARAATTSRDELRRRFGSGPIAESTGAANDQHYEVSPQLFETILGPNRKYSCGLWDETTTTLLEAEERMLALTAERARVADGQTILDLGCGWGSFSLWIARRYPRARVLAVSNSAPQVETVQRCAEEAGLDNVEAECRDINELAPARRFDRIVSVEMLEHTRNQRELLRRISTWLEDDGLLFAHHFAHRERAYRYDDGDQRQWMARHFFTGGIMPSADLLAVFDDHMEMIEAWDVSGLHYHRTCEAWLRNMELHRSQVESTLERGYGPVEARRRWHLWRVFFLACSELFRYQDGREWYVAHRLLAPRASARRGAA